MGRSRYWKLTADEVEKLTHDPGKILNWEIKGIRKPEEEAKFIGVSYTVKEHHLITR